MANKKEVIFYHKNARPYTSLATRQKLHTFSWKIMSHSPYSPGIAPSNYHLFQSLRNDPNEQKFNSLEAVKNGLHKFFAHKLQGFYSSEIIKLDDTKMAQDHQSKWPIYNILNKLFCTKFSFYLQEKNNFP